MGLTDDGADADTDDREDEDDGVDDREDEDDGDHDSEAAADGDGPAGGADTDGTDGSGDRLLDLAGLAIAGFLVFGVAVGAFAALSGPSDDAQAAPDVEWSFERVNESHVRIAHAGGPPVETRDLVVTSDGVRRGASWPNSLSTGESGTVRADEGVVVRLYWTTETGERVKLDEWQA